MSTGGGGNLYVDPKTIFTRDNILLGHSWTLLSFMDGFRSQRVTTGAVGGSSSALVTVTWAVPFTDTNYTVVVSVVDSTASTAALSIMHIEAITKTAIQVRVQNSAVGALTGTLHAIATHD